MRSSGRVDFASRPQRASQDKIGAISRYPIIGLDQVDELITDPLDTNPLIHTLQRRTRTWVSDS